MKQRTRDEPSIAERIASFIASAASTEVPRKVRDIVKLHLLDGLANVVLGAGEASAILLRRHYQIIRAKADASAFGTNERFAAEHAALINGVQGHTLDYDDAQLTTLPSRPTGQQTHPTAPVLAATLALAESRGASGTDFLTAYTVGVEVACRLGDAVDPTHYLNGFHPTGTLGAFGATAACAYLLKLKPAAICHALGIAGTLCSGLRANRGTMAKGLNAGRAAQNGLLAAKLGSEGFTASQDIFEDPMGFFAASSNNRFDRSLLHFGEPFFFVTPGIAIKLYPCAGVLHPMLDLLLQLRVRYSLDPEAVKTVSVKLNRDAARPLVFDRPVNGLQSKFSLPFAAAVALVDGAAGLKQFTDDRPHDPAVKRLMQRVKFLKRPPAKNTRRIGIDTTVEIAMKNDVVFGARGRIARGHPLRPASWDDVEDKFRQCAEAILPLHRIRAFLENFRQIDSLPSLTAWLGPLRSPRR
jgi:2-methylcitrate dehydratase PrpD